MANKKNDFIDIVSIVKEWLNNWYWFVISAVVCVALAFVYTKIKKPVYQVHANLLIAQSDDGPGGLLGDMTSLFGGNGYVEDELFVVSSHNVLRSVVKDLQANKNHIVRNGFLLKDFKYQDYPVDVYLDPAIADTLRGGVDFRIKVNDKGHIDIRAKYNKNTVAEVEADKFPVIVPTPVGKFVVNKTQYFVPGEKLRTDISYLGYDAAAEVLAKEITFDIASQRSNVIQIAMKSPSIPYAKDLLNNIMVRYNLKGKETKKIQADSTAKFIETRLQRLANQLNNSESEVQKYKNEHGIVDVSTEASVNLTRRERYENKAVEAATQLEILKMTRDFLANPSNAYQLIPATSLGEENAGVNSTISQYNELILKRMELEQNARSNNTSLKKLSEQIDALRSNIITSLDRSVAQQSIAVKQLNQQIRNAQSRLGNIPAQERQFRDIQRQQTIREQLYIYLLQRQEETGMMAANALAKGVVIDEAFALNDPVGMKKSMKLALAFVFGLCLPPVVLYLRRTFKNKFATRQEVEQIVHVPVLGEICNSMAAKETPLVVRPKTTSSAAELFRLIRTNLNFMLRGDDQKVVLVTSTKSGEGKSFVSINLAASLALLGKKVLLVGMDIRSPRLARYLNLPEHRGLTEYLSTPSMNVDEIIMREPVATNLDIILSGPVPPNPSELLCEPRVDEFIEMMKQRYDYVIIDSAPVGMVSDTFALNRFVNATIYVCRANYTSITDLEYINTVRDHDRLRNMAVIVNGTTATQGYGYGYTEPDKKGKNKS